MFDSRLNFRRILSCLTLILIGLLLAPADSRAQNRVDLEDLTIKGELLNDNRLRMSSRDQHQISDRVSYRNNFRKEITDGLEVQWPDQDGVSRGTASQAPQGGGQ